MAQKIVQQMGHTALLAENGKIAVDVLAEEPVDLVLMDVQMPIMDGIEASRQIRHVLGKSKQSLPIVGLTASFQHSDMPMYLDIGMNTCLSKPVRLETLRRTIDAVVSRCALGLYA
jgi:two-component system sensor histidine kinase/response regulator